MQVQSNTYASEQGEELHVSFWRVDDESHRLQTNDPDVVRRLKTWEFAKETGWGWNVYLYIFVIPNTKARWVAKQFGFNGPARSAKQQEVTRNLIKQSQGHRFSVNHSGQTYPYTPHRATITQKGIPTPQNPAFGSQKAVQIQERASI